MPKYELPPGWPDPYDLLRDIKYEENYPKILLRGIYNVMNRGEVSRAEYWFVAGFNFATTRLVKARPPRIFPAMVLKGDIGLETLTKKGKEREGEVIGIRDLSQESIRKYGKKTRSQMEMDTKKKLKELARWVNLIRQTTEKEGMPDIRSIEQGGQP